MYQWESSFLKLMNIALFSFTSSFHSLFHAYSWNYSTFLTILCTFILSPSFEKQNSIGRLTNIYWSWKRIVLTLSRYIPSQFSLYVQRMRYHPYSVLVDCAQSSKWAELHAIMYALFLICCSHELLFSTFVQISCLTNWMKKSFYVPVLLI